MFVPVLTATLTTLVGVHSAGADRRTDGRRRVDAADRDGVRARCVAGRVFSRVARASARQLREDGEARRSHGARWKPAERARDRLEARFVHFRDVHFMGLVRRALDYPGATLCAAVGGIVCALSLVISQHVGINFVTGFDIESLDSRRRVQRVGNRCRQGRVHRRTRAHARRDERRDRFGESARLGDEAQRRDVQRRAPDRHAIRIDRRASTNTRRIARCARRRSRTQWREQIEGAAVRRAVRARRRRRRECRPARCHARVARRDARIGEGRRRSSWPRCCVRSKACRTSATTCRTARSN